jgi:hypothetical protein
MWHFKVLRVEVKDEADEATFPGGWEPFHAEASTISGGGWVVYLRQDDGVTEPPPK